MTRGSGLADTDESWGGCRAAPVSAPFGTVNRMLSFLAAVRDNDTGDALDLILVLIGVLCIAGAAWRAWLRDVPVAVALLLIGVVILAVFGSDV